ncbi:transposase [Streptomyces sp. NPDC017448]|uniref:transposase n=1 Tax=Streptomyces sp. NPDC017448 TaxID=3364996 RepID=UPI0037A8093C
MGRGGVADEQWAVSEPPLPKGAKAGRPPARPRRQVVDGIRFRVRTGVPWRDVPDEYGPWGRVYDLFRRWQRNRTWHRIVSRLPNSLSATRRPSSSRLSTSGCEPRPVLDEPLARYAGCAGPDDCRTVLRFLLRGDLGGGARTLRFTILR